MTHTLCFGFVGTKELHSVEDAPPPGVGEHVTLNGRHYTVAYRTFTYRTDNGGCAVTAVLKPEGSQPA